MTASSFNKRTSSRPTGNDEQGHTKSGGGVQFTQTESAHAGNEKLMRNPSSAQPQQSHSKAASAAYQDIQHSQHANSGANEHRPNGSATITTVSSAAIRHGQYPQSQAAVE